MHSQQPVSSPEHSDPTGPTVWVRPCQQSPATGTAATGAAANGAPAKGEPDTGAATFVPLVQETLVDSKSAPSPLEPSTHLARQPLLFDRYEPIGPFLDGGMGVVYKVRDTVLGRTVALKTMKAFLLGQPHQVERFLREARAVAQLKHDHIINIFEFDARRGEPYFTMEYMEGGSLGSRVADFPKKDAKEIVTLMEKVARAVGYAHSKDIIHRDLKPGNILLDHAGQPKVSDFGLAKFLKDGADLTRADQVLGTWCYMSPEQALGNRDTLSPATDVWSLGVILYELLTGKRPFSGDSKDKVSREICKNEPLPASCLRKNLDAGLERILDRCMAKDTAHRYRHAGELADALREWLDRDQGPSLQRSLAGFCRRCLWRLRKNRLLVAMAAVGIAALVFLALSMRDNDPNAWEKKIQRDLRDGKTVTLIGKTGKPEGYRWVLGKERSALPITEEGTLEVSCWGVGLFELCSDPGIDAYRIKAEVRHINARQFENVGIYFFHSLEPCPQGFMHCFTTWEFSDQWALKENSLDTKKNCVFMRSYLLGEGFLYGPNRVVNGPYPYQKFAIGDPLDPPWRKLEVEVSPENVVVSWEGEVVSSAKLAEMNRSGRANVARRKDAEVEGYTLDINPRQGLGLFIMNGAAEFRNVILEPRSK